MSNRKTLKSVSVEGLKPTITLTPVVEPCGEGFRIHHIKSDSIARDGRDTFVPLRHVSKQKRRIFELEEENAKLRELVAEMYEAVKCCCDECWFGYGHNPAKCKNENCGYRKEYVAMRELGVEEK